MPRSPRVLARAASEQKDAQLDGVFFALSDPIRRRILERLEDGALLVSELAEPFGVSLQAVARHIDVLVEAGLIKKERTGRITRCSLEVGPIHGAAVWMNRYSKYWQGQFELLASALGRIERGRNAAPTDAPAAGHSRKKRS